MFRQFGGMALAAQMTDEMTEAAERLHAEMLAVQEIIGSPIGAEPRSEDSRLAEYMTLRGNPYAWYTWMATKVGKWQEKAAEFGINISEYEPWVAAKNLAVKYSAEMEAMLAKWYSKRVGAFNG